MANHQASLHTVAVQLMVSSSHSVHHIVMLSASLQQLHEVSMALINCYTTCPFQGWGPNCDNAQKVRHSQPTLAEARPACLAEWDCEHNETEGFYPDVITLGSGKLVHWICSCCPRGQPHRWTARPVTAYQWAAGVQFVLVGKLVSAAHWSLYFHPLQLSLMWIKTASGLLM